MRWEYKTVQYSKRNMFGGALKMDTDEFTAMLNKVGAEGWELISTTQQLGWHGQGLVLIFKRPR